MVVVALVSGSCRIGTEQHAHSVLASIDSAAIVRKEQSAQSHVDLLILYLAASDNERTTLSPDIRRALYTATGTIRGTLVPAEAAFPYHYGKSAAPSVIARALRWFLTGARYLDYPIQDRGARRCERVDLPQTSTGVG